MIGLNLLFLCGNSGVVRVPDVGAQLSPLLEGVRQVRPGEQTMYQVRGVSSPRKGRGVAGSSLAPPRLRAGVSSGWWAVLCVCRLWVVWLDLLFQSCQ